MTETIEAPGSVTAMERGSGVALWRQIADRIRQGIAEGTFEEGGRLPPEIALAERFGVNRHTVRGAIAALVQEGVLRAEQGRGTFVQHAPRISYALGRYTRFSANLQGQVRETKGRLLASAVVPADSRTAGALGLDAGASVLRLDTLSEADGHPVSRATSWFDAIRFSGMEDAYAKTGSITAAFARCGIDDYMRRSTVVSARHADATVLANLSLSAGAIVLVTVAINEDPEGRAIQFSETLFAADRVELVVGEGL
ncbi:MAG: phosphonate metabolism transcriptional regulator PhnF [Neoaquamicrobium sediminum]|uniref:phosphonate metabolism transcriptional regulator PhnF n=1 Tax=Neoaquamicrobium sediminum TaxID=1849104 RepID=UPI00403692D8